MARVVRHESERDVWEMIHGAPDPRLGGYVLNYCAYDERTGSFSRRRELPVRPRRGDREFWGADSRLDSI